MLKICDLAEQRPSSVNFQVVYDKFLQYTHSLIAWDCVHPNQIGATLMAKEWLSKCGFEYDHTPEA